MTKTGRLVGLIGALGLGAAALAGCGSASTPNASSTGANQSQPLTNITVGYQPDLHGAAPMLIAQKEGFFKKEGLNVKLVRFTAGPALFDALQAGQLDIGYEGPGVMFLVVKGDAKVLTVDSVNYGDEVIANPGITSVAQLKGKKVAVVLGTSAQMILDLALQKAGIPTSAVTAVNMTPATAAAAYSSHKVQALALWIPPIVAAQKAVPGSNVLVTDRNFSPAYQFPQQWITSNSYYQTHKSTLVKFLAAWILADNWRKTHFAQDVAMTSQATGIPASSLQPQIQATEWLSGQQLGRLYQSRAELGWYKKLEQFFVKDGLLSSVSPPSHFVKTGLFMQALKMVESQK